MVELTTRLVFTGEGRLVKGHSRIVRRRRCGSTATRCGGRSGPSEEQQGTSGWSYTVRRCSNTMELHMERGERAVVLLA